MDRTSIHAKFVERYSVPPMTVPASVTPDAIREVERELGITFPESYLSFIVTHGPVFTPDVSRALGECATCVPPDEEVFAVSEFLAPEQIVRDYRVCTSGGMPDFLVPVAVDLGGHPFGFRREVARPRPGDCPVLVFDHDYCVIRSAGESFDAWLEYFLTLKA